MLVEHNVAQANVSGFEVENSSGVTVQRNLATGNTGGFLTFALPGLDVHVNRAPGSSRSPRSETSSAGTW